MGKRRDPVREYLEREAAGLAARAAEGEEVSAARVDDLARVARLLDIRDAATPRRRNWLPAGVLLVSLSAASALLFARVRETAIELDAAASAVRFTAFGQAALTGPMRLETLGASGLAGIRLPSGMAGDAAAPAVRLSAIDSPKGKGTVSLDPLIVPSGAEISVQAAGVSREYVLSVAAPELDLRANVDGAVLVAAAGGPARIRNEAAPAGVTMRGGPNVDLALGFPSLPSAPFASPLRVRGISLSRVEQFVQPGRSLVRVASTVLAGTLYLESLDGENRPLRPGEELSFEESAGEIGMLRLEEGGIALRYHGRVRGMTTGSGEGRRSLMPTLLEWMRARHGLSLLWGVTLYLSGIAAAVLRWWGARA